MLTVAIFEGDSDGESVPFEEGEAKVALGDRVAKKGVEVPLPETVPLTVEVTVLEAFAEAEKGAVSEREADCSAERLVVGRDVVEGEEQGVLLAERAGEAEADAEALLDTDSVAESKPLKDAAPLPMDDPVAPPVP